MENSERVSGEQSNQNNIKAGAFKPNPTRYNRDDAGVSAGGGAGENGEEGANFDQQNNEPEINPGKLNNEEIDLDRTGPDNSPTKQSLNAQAQAAGKQNQQQDNQQGGDRGLAETSENKSLKKPEQKESLLGQGGYGTSGTSGTNSGGKQGYQSGLGSAGSQNGSTGYNAGSQGIDQTKGA